MEVGRFRVLRTFESLNGIKRKTIGVSLIRKIMKRMIQMITTRITKGVILTMADSKKVRTNRREQDSG